MTPAARILHSLLCVVLLCGAPGSTAAQWQPDRNDAREISSADAIERFRTKSALDMYFAEAHGYAVFPWVARFGFGSGFAHGRGIVIEQGRTVGRTALWQFIHGIWAGAEVHSMIIFFRNPENIDVYKTGQWQFVGRAGVALATVGASKDPAFVQGVAVFTQTRAGLLTEAAVGVARYRFQPIQ